MRRSGGFGLDRVRVMDRENEEVHLVKDGGGGGGGGGKKTPFLDRSKVRILLCDNDVKSSKEVFELLCKCSYQVTSVRTPRQVIDALNAEGRDIDLILAEVDLPVAKGLKMLKYIMRDKELQRIPIIMMSAKDEVSVVVKCLKRGAADYLVKPLRTNELLNLWTHMWRRREMLGLAEKNILNYDFDLVASDPSDPNTNSTTLFSDDTDDKSRRSTIQEIPTSNLREDESNAATFMEPPLKDSSKNHLDAPGTSDWRTGKFSAFLKKSELKIGVSSAFFTYVKSSLTTSSQKVDHVNENAATVEHSCRGQKQLGTDIQIQQTRASWEDYCRNGSAVTGAGIDTTNIERPCIPLAPLDDTDGRNSKEEQRSEVLLRPRKDTQLGVSGGQALASYPYYLPGVMNQFMIPSQAQLYQGNPHDLAKSFTSSVQPQYNPHLHPQPQPQPYPHPHPHPHHTHVPGMSSFPYYPVNVCMQPGQMPMTHMWPSIANSSSNEVKPSRYERREAALIKFRQKRKDRCFDKKIRYINRKKLAERRPRVRGQFVRQVNGIDVDLNGRPAGFDDFDDDGEEDVDEEELGYRDSSIDGETSGY